MRSFHDVPVDFEQENAQKLESKISMKKIKIPLPKLIRAFISIYCSERYARRNDIGCKVITDER